MRPDILGGVSIKISLDPPPIVNCGFTARRQLHRELPIPGVAKIAKLQYQQTKDPEFCLSEGFAWLDAGEPNRAVKPLLIAQTAYPDRPDLRFALGSHLLTQDQPEAAMIEWRKALQLDPGNWIIHKQIWAVEHPEAFYEGAVDYSWQGEELQREAAE